MLWQTLGINLKKMIIQDKKIREIDFTKKKCVKINLAKYIKSFHSLELDGSLVHDMPTA